MKLAALVEALSAIAKDHPEAEIVMSDGETAYNLRERPIAWSDFPHDGNGSVTLYYGGLADALGPRSEERRVGTECVRTRKSRLAPYNSTNKTAEHNRKAISNHI